MDSIEFKRAVTIDKKVKKVINNMESEKASTSKRNTPAEELAKPERSYRSKRSIEEEDDATDSKRQKITQLITQYCYPTLIVAPVVTSIILILFSPINLIIKVFTIALLILSMFVYYNQNMKPLMCSRKKSK